MKYVMSDLHGCYNEFILMLKKINFSSDDTLYIVGDVIDRGPEPIKLLLYIMKHDNIFLLKGNHEEMMQICLLGKDITNNIIWNNNGGDITWDQYELLNKNEKLDIFKYISNLPLYKIIHNKYLLVHAGIDFNIINNDISLKDNMHKQKSDDILWIRNDFLNYDKMENVDFITIFGHTPTIFLNEKKPMKIWFSKQKIGIDCGIVFNEGQLGCLCLDNLKEYYIKKIEV